MNDRDENQKLVRNYLLNESDEEYRQASAEEENLLKNYLLGELDEPEREEIEERLLIDEDFFKTSLLVESELIDDYVKGELSADERKKFEATILRTPSGHQQVEIARELRQYAADKQKNSSSVINQKKESWNKEAVSISWWRRTLQSPYFQVAATILITLGISLFVYRGMIYHPPANKGLVLLKEAFKDQRTLQARISEFDYAPFIKERGNKENDYDPNKARRAADLLQTEVDEHRDNAEVLHGLGRYYLAVKDFDRAIQFLNRALEKDANNAEIHSDLGAAFLEKGKSLLSNKDFANSGIAWGNSLEHLNKALEKNGSLLPALFNRALLHQEMGSSAKAEEDWNQYLKKDTQSEWADEAREKLKNLEEHKKIALSTSEDKIFQNFLNAYQSKNEEATWTILIQNNNLAGGIVENILLNEYLELSLNQQKDEAQRRIQALSYIAALWKRRTDDNFTTKLVQFYNNTTDAQKKSLKRARKFSRSGQRLLRSSKFTEAINKYQKAKLIFREISATCEEHLIDYQLGQSYLLQTKPQAALVIFEETSKLCTENHYTWLQSQLYLAMANAHLALSDYSNALLKSNRSLEMSEGMGNVNSIMKAYTQIGLEYVYLNNYHKALEYHIHNIELLKTYLPEPIQSWRIYFLTAQTFNKLNLYSAAVECQEQTITIAEELGSPLLIWRSYYPLGLIYANQGKYDEGLKQIWLAYDKSSALTDPIARKEATAQTFLQFGHLYRQKRDFNAAIQNYDLAIQNFDELQYGAFSYVAHKGKLLCCLSQEKCSSIDQEIATTLDLFENYRAKILEENNKNIFFDTEQNVYDAIIDFEYLKKDSLPESAQTAFELSERSRARYLLDLINLDVQITNTSYSSDKNFESKIKGLSEIQTNLSDNTQILQYALLEKKILIWVISNKEFHCTSYDISDAVFNERVINYLDLIKNPSTNALEKFLHESEFLYNILISPVEQWLNKSKQICIIPDKILNFVSFAALVSPTSKSYFLEDYAIQFSPSSNIFTLSSDAAREKESVGDERLFGVGNPAFDRSLFTLDELSEAIDEVNRIKGFYNQESLLLTGTKATKHYVKREMEKADVIHFAVHAITHESSPLLSKLILAAGPSPVGKNSGHNDKLGNGSILTCQDIYDLNLTRPRLVVLSACQTAVERYYRGEGMIGIARPFIAKRIPLVVASLWAVNSEPTKDLMISFHMYRKRRGLPTIEALRQAQLDMLHGSNKNRRLPYHWAAFIPIGGYARF